MGYFTAWECSECHSMTDSAKMFRNLNEDFALKLGEWVYKHSHCLNEYDTGLAIIRRTESDPEWIGAPMGWEEVAEKEVNL